MKSVNIRSIVIDVWRNTYRIAAQGDGNTSLGKLIQQLLAVHMGGYADSEQVGPIWTSNLITSVLRGRQEIRDEILTVGLNILRLPFNHLFETFDHHRRMCEARSLSPVIPYSSWTILVRVI